MERANLVRLLLVGVVAIFAVQYFGVFGKDEPSPEQPFYGRLGYESAPPERSEPALCPLEGNRFRAELTSRGGALKHVYLTDPKYTATDSDQPIDLVTTTSEWAAPLRTDLRFPCHFENLELEREGGEKERRIVCAPAGEADQVDYNNLDWKLAEQAPGRCIFTYESAHVALTKTIVATERPFELSVVLEIENRADQPRKHRLTVEQTDWRHKEEVEGSLGRRAELETLVEAHVVGDTERLSPSDFDADEFDPEEGFTSEGWKRLLGNPSWAAVSSSFFTKALFPLEAPETPVAELLIEHHWDRQKYKSQSADPDPTYVYRARLAYPLRSLEPKATARYELLAFVGPKERQALHAAGGAGTRLEADELLDLGYFGVIGNLLIAYLYWLHRLVGTWGWAICLLTITVKMVLFPLSITQIKSAFGMRKLKPQLDELNAKYKDDVQQRTLKMQELMRKNNVTNPMLGCLPLLLQMPVWFALYQALQTAVELYHTPFGPFIPDLSAPGKYFIIPAALGASSFLQQHLMPMQGDPLQQKMMKYFMPAMFTAFMLFLPAGLGIYFLTNTWLGILQQLAVERYYKAREAKESAAVAEAPEQPKKDEPAPSKGKGKGGKGKGGKGTRSAVVEPTS
jgi:YidC/Oxa1 family membrane protein insertase